MFINMAFFIISSLFGDNTQFMISAELTFTIVSLPYRNCFQRILSHHFVLIVWFQLFCSLLIAFCYISARLTKSAIFGVDPCFFVRTNFKSRMLQSPTLQVYEYNDENKRRSPLDCLVIRNYQFNFCRKYWCNCI